MLSQHYGRCMFNSRHSAIGFIESLGDVYASGVGYWRSRDAAFNVDVCTTTWLLSMFRLTMMFLFQVRNRDSSHHAHWVISQCHCHQRGHGRRWFLLHDFALTWPRVRGSYWVLFLPRLLRQCCLRHFVVYFVLILWLSFLLSPFHSLRCFSLF